MENALTLEELELETTEYLPDRLVMGAVGGCNPCYNPCDSFRLSLHVSLCVSLSI